jgi:prepilin-type N-terminal cleavage/methylation domain-containing protein
MNSNSKKSAGFGLIEVIISMAIFGVISIGVYNGYRIMIKQTKDGQVKQTSTLIGKEIVEGIKSVAGDNFKINNIEGKEKESIQLTSNFNVAIDSVEGEKNRIYKISTLPRYYDQNGNLTNISDAKYEADIKFTPKMDAITDNTIQESSEANVCYWYVTNKDSGLELSKVEPQIVGGVKEQKTIKITVPNDLSSDFKIEADSGEKTFNMPNNNGVTNIIYIDFKYCNIDDVKVEVDSSSKDYSIKNPINICIRNNNNVKIANGIKGVVNAYYRSSSDDKLGVLYDINVIVKDLRKVEKNTIFESNFFQNINIEDE